MVAGKSLSTPVSAVMNANCVWFEIDAPAEKLLAHLGRNGITHIPLCDNARRVVDYAAIHHLRSLPVSSPDLSGNELAYVVDCVRTGWISSQGQYVRDFEKLFGEFIGSPHAVAVSNGTVALHLALVTLGIGPGDEVVVPDFTFVASINAILHAGATPVLVDVDPHTWTIDVDEVSRAITPRTKAIMPVHLFGQPCDLGPLQELAASKGLCIVEDCAEALGSSYKGTKVGVFGDASAFSFFGNKTITTGEGGMVLFRDSTAAERARRLRDHGQSASRKYWNDEVGYNYRMTNLQAAVGVAQMERIDQFVSRKMSLGTTYERGLGRVAGLQLREPCSWATSVCWLFTCLIDEGAGITRGELIQKLALNGIEARPAFCPLHEMPPYRRFARMGRYDVTTDLARRGFSLPSAVGLESADLESVISAIRGMFTVGRLVSASERQ